MADLEARITRLEAESQIRQLIAHYCFDIDDRHIAAIGRLFTADGVLRSADGVMYAEGPEAIIAQYHRRFDVLGPGHHFMHDVQIDFVGDGTQEATGRVSGHAELMRKGQMMIAALRYADRYRRTAEGWKFAERVISFLYYVPVEDYPGILLTPDRNRAYDRPMPADFPEPLASWQAYHQNGRRP
ncbi:MAG TPA: nuclear transport factor 2 family protein [Novosphingobium sp.]|nr:nuclear transport factor 2 family protein [Novosphingobium sp.]HZV10215.1 nuclear transport factor 2 family protein [Novosphingobium sp.]